MNIYHAPVTRNVTGSGNERKGKRIRRRGNRDLRKNPDSDRRQKVPLDKQDNRGFSFFLSLFSFWRERLKYLRVGGQKSGKSRISFDTRINQVIRDWRAKQQHQEIIGPCSSRVLFGSIPIVSLRSRRTAISLGVHTHTTPKALCLVCDSFDRRDWAKRFGSSGAKRHPHAPIKILSLCTFIVRYSK